MAGLSTPVIGTENKLRYGGKEIQDEIGGLDQYDFGARYYDPATARWNQLDPLAEEAADWTPYRYCYNNPLRYTDPTGMKELPKFYPFVYFDWALDWAANGGDYGITRGYYFLSNMNSDEHFYWIPNYEYNWETGQYERLGRELNFWDVVEEIADNPLFGTKVGFEIFYEDAIPVPNYAETLTASLLGGILPQKGGEKVHSDEKFGPGAVQKNKIGIDGDTEIEWNNYGHPDKIDIMDADGENVLFRVNGGQPFTGGNAPLFRAGVLYDQLGITDPSFHMTITVRVIGGFEKPTEFEYTVYNATFIGGNVVKPPAPKL
jgi:RHS repeat-associated protein